jgi:hypothetical protein
MYTFEDWLNDRINEKTGIPDEILGEIPTPLAILRDQGKISDEVLNEIYSKQKETFDKALEINFACWKNDFNRKIHDLDVGQVKEYITLELERLQHDIDKNKRAYQDSIAERRFYNIPGSSYKDTLELWQQKENGVFVEYRPKMTKPALINFDMCLNRMVKQYLTDIQVKHERFYLKGIDIDKLTKELINKKFIKQPDESNMIKWFEGRFSGKIRISKPAVHFICIIADLQEQHFIDNSKEFCYQYIHDSFLFNSKPSEPSYIERMMKPRRKPSLFIDIRQLTNLGGPSHGNLFTYPVTYFPISDNHSLQKSKLNEKPVITAGFFYFPFVKKA